MHEPSDARPHVKRALRISAGLIPFMLLISAVGDRNVAQETALVVNHVAVADRPLGSLTIRLKPSVRA
jgi:hypothetical protein